MSYIKPTDYGISDDYQDHVNRNSKEPGTDYKTPYGTPLRAASNGVVSHVSNSNSGAAGRRVTIDLDDGRRVSYIHLSKIYVRLGQHVKAGEFIAESGASGYGKDWYYGPHVHVSLWKKPGMGWADTIDFELFTFATSGGKINKDKETEDMDFINIQGKAGSHHAGQFAIYRKNNDGTLVAKRLTKGSLNPALPTFDDEALTELKKAMPFIDLV